MPVSPTLPRNDDVQPAAHTHRSLGRWPTYLRAVVTTRCPMRCTYCHMEGDPAGAGPRQLDTATLGALLRVAARAGVEKFKFLGGEPLVRADMAQVVAALRVEAPTADLSVITAGVTLPDALPQCLAAGLDRANLSVHGFDLPAFERRGGNLRTWQLRNASLRHLVAAGRPLKLNYVLSGPEDHEDLGALLAWAAGQPVVVNVLDDLGDPQASAETVTRTLHALRGPAARAEYVEDVHSLPTTHLVWADGLRVEVKDHRLGDLAPWAACATCPVRARCREGIFALRLSHDGQLRACMDRPDLSLDVAGILRAEGEAAALQAWLGFVEGLLTGAQRQAA